MTCAEEIYKFTLQQLAAEGNEQAKLALAMGAQAAPALNNNSLAICDLQSAESALHSAINANATKWTSSTDRRITEALQMITKAIIKIKC